MLEIQVKDVQKVVDTLEEAVDFVVAEIKRWYNANDDKPLSITLTRQGSRAPPVVNISVGENQTTKEALG